MLSISTHKEKKIAKNFLKNGYIIFDIEDKTFDNETLDTK